MNRQNPRIPTSCPEGFKGRYTVSPGDTLFTLSQIFRVRLEALYANNPHIPNPNLLIPGDVLCVPSQIPIPCCIELKKNARLPFGTGAVAYANFGPRGGQSISILATLPAPSYFGNYDIYIATAYFKDIGGFGNELFPTGESPPTLACRIELPTVVSLSSDVLVTIQPSNSTTGFSGPVIYQNTLLGCCRSECNPINNNIRKLELAGSINAPNASGFAEVNLNPAKAVIIGINLPTPESYGSSYKTYRGWIIDFETQNRFRIDLQITINNIWVGQAQDGSLADFDNIIVTAEPVPGASSPTGPTVLSGSLHGC